MSHTKKRWHSVFIYRLHQQYKTSNILIYLKWECSCLDCFPAGIIHQSITQVKQQLYDVVLDVMIHKVIKKETNDYKVSYKKTIFHAVLV